MNSIIVLILGFIVFFIGYRYYARYIDSKVIKSDPKRATPAKMYNGRGGIHAHQQKHPLWLPV